MQRRTVLKRLGTVGAATAGIAGTASASPTPVDIDRKVDVSDVSGRVSLDELVDEQTLAESSVDPGEVEYHIADHLDWLDLSAQDCCHVCTYDNCGDSCDCCELHVC